MSYRFQLPRPAAFLFASSLMLVACESSRHSPGAATPPAPSTPASATPPTGTPTSPESTAVQPCAAGQLALGETGSDAGAGHRALHLAVRNTSAKSCTLERQIRVRLMDASDQPVAGVAVEQREDSAPQANAAPAPLTLPSGGSASFQVVYAAPTGGLPCHAITALEVSPSAGAALRLTHAFEACSEHVTVTPLQFPAEQ